MTITTTSRKLLTMAGSAVVLSFATQAADHLDAPALSGNGQLDIADIYAYQSPNNPNNTVLVMTVNPFAGNLSPTTFGTSAAAGTGVEYEFKVDTDGDAFADITYNLSFSGTGPTQYLKLTRNGVETAGGFTGNNLLVAGGGMVRAGLFDDPFFFDLAGFQNGFNFTGDDAFAGADVSGIILELPISDLNGATNVGVWGRTLQDGNQVDRIGRPAINTVLVPGGRKDEFNEAIPSDDFADFESDVSDAIASLNGGDTATADAITSVLLPDILTIDVTDPSGFLNGRQLTDDVIDAELNLLSSGGVTTDLVDANDVPFSNVFPYLAFANAVPAPATLVLMLFGILGLRIRARIS